MSIAAAVTQYRKDMVAQFAQKSSLLRAASTKETVINGNTATFLVNGTAGDTAVTRGTNGLIPYSATQNTQVAVTLAEAHAPYKITGFNAFASQGDQVRSLREGSIGVINRTIDLKVLSALSSATQTAGSAATASLDLVTKCRTILAANQVPVNEVENMFAVVSPAFMGYLMQIPEFSSEDYVDIKPMGGGVAVGGARRWFGVNWIESPLITGIGTAAEYCYMYHRAAIGYAINMGEEAIKAGYDEEQDYSWSRASLAHGASVLQNTGIVKITHDGSAYAAS